ncbi:DUF4336 domain-containing protein [Teichococcus vastitatis]|uniref:DUF4336 domain-containing protein n=1 Tax=Teichococcus vastitatis TaxID=2307076 RepID=A0ABS9W1Q5_9PROT|nr:DUF4336 domain-containing protein [Pseudoroseomonas vastitatis]MCI0753137.1 DUF4336 domain-containing protein [Pseudoroseomonas vastitatis]
MIPTRLHGAIDYTVAAALGGLAANRALPPAVRAVLGGAGAFHASYSAATDYEAGLTPAISMRQHLALDAAGGAALVLAGLTMRRQPDDARALLIGLGLAELAVVALSSAQPRSGPGQGTMATRLLGSTGEDAAATIGYPPLDRLKPVAEDVFVVDSIMSAALGVTLPVRMTVFRLPDGDLLLHSPTRFDFRLWEELERIGPIRHLVAPNIVHWTFLEEWQRHCRDAMTWAAPGLRDRGQVRRSGVRLDRDLGESVPAEWGNVLRLIEVRGGGGFREMALFHHPSATLVLTDMAMNFEPSKLPWAMRGVARLFGVTAPDGMPPPYLRAVVRWHQREAADAAARLLALQPERVIFAHGRWFERDGAAQLRRSLRWLLG